MVTTVHAKTDAESAETCAEIPVNATNTGFEKGGIRRNSQKGSRLDQGVLPKQSFANPLSCCGDCSDFVLRVKLFFHVSQYFPIINS
jgi:hypothetical protein